jgi:hypothetical protein
MSEYPATQDTSNDHGQQQVRFRPLRQNSVEVYPVGGELLNQAAMGVDLPSLREGI